MMFTYIGLQLSLKVSVRRMVTTEARKARKQHGGGEGCPPTSLPCVFRAFRASVVN